MRNGWIRVLAGSTALLVLALAVGSAANAQGTNFAGRRIVVTSYGGVFEEFVRKEVVPGFEQLTGAKVELAVGISRDFIVKMRAAGPSNPPYDVLIADTAFVSLARKEGHIAKLPIQSVPNLKDVWPILRNKDDLGVVGLVAPIGIAYRPDLVSTQPKVWKDLWRSEYKGKLGIYSIANSAAPMFLMLVAKIFSGNEKNMDVAFQKVKELMPVRLIDFSGDMEKFLTTGEIQVGILDGPAAVRLRRQGIQLAWVLPLEGTFMFAMEPNVTSGSRNKDVAYAYVNYFLSPEVQTKWASQFYWTPANRKVKMTAELAQLVPVHTQAQIRSLLTWDWDWVNSGVREQMIDRWNREIVGR